MHHLLDQYYHCHLFCLLQVRSVIEKLVPLEATDGCCFLIAGQRENDIHIGYFWMARDGRIRRRAVSLLVAIIDDHRGTLGFQ